MQRWLIFVMGLLFLSGPAFGQTATDSQTLQALLAEVRQLRQELRATAITAQRSQILLHRLQVQESAAARASQRLDDARSKLAEVQASQKSTAAQIQQYNNVKEHIEDPAAKKQFEDAIAQLQAKFEAQASEEQQRQAREIEAEDQSRVEQGRLAALQDQLDQLDRELLNSMPSAK
jgi:hypothetical protein